VIRAASGNTSPRHSRSANRSAARHAVALGIQTFEVADQQQAEIATRRQGRSPFVRIGTLAQPLDEAVEVVLIEQLIQSRVERIAEFRGRSWLATRIDACFACGRRLPTAIGVRVVRGQACEQQIYSVLFSIWGGVSSWEVLNYWSCWH
jgi:hypothetical protein